MKSFVTYFYNVTQIANRDHHSNEKNEKKKLGVAKMYFMPEIHEIICNLL